MSRLHPFDYALGAVAADWFPRIQEAGPDAAADRGRFARLPEVQRWLEASAGGSPEPGSGEAFLDLLYAGFRYWDAGCRTMEVARPRLAARLDALPPRPLSIPGGACYLRFPERWFWSRVDDRSPHEPLDGMFVVSAAGAREILMLAVLGLRPERGGFSQVVAWAAPGDVGAAVEQARPPRFAPVMDAGSAAGFQSVSSVAELLLLGSLALGAAGE